MATAAVGPAPRPELRDRIVAAARAEPQNVVSLEARRRGRAAPLLGAVAAVAATVAIGLGVYASSLSGELDDTKAVIAQLSDPSARAIGLEGASGRLLVKPDGDAVLVVAGLPKREGKTYAVWVIDSGRKPVPAGLFDDAVRRDRRPGRAARSPTAPSWRSPSRTGPSTPPPPTPIVTSQAV